MNEIRSCQPVLVFGAGKSGLAAAGLLQRNGLEYGISDSCSMENLIQLLKVNDLTPAFTEAGRQSPLFFSMFPTVVISPGCDLKTIFSSIDEVRSTTIISEIELAFGFFEKPVLAVTGTNGKTTTTALLGDLLGTVDPSVKVCGNIGFPFSGLIKQDSVCSAAVVEVSSYQLECIRSFRPHVAVITNITPDHLSRHGTMKEYTRVKFRIAENMGLSDRLILNVNLGHVADSFQGLAEKTGVVYFGIHPGGHRDQKIWIESGMVMLRAENEDKLIPVCAVSDIRIPGDHNLENVLAAVLAAYYFGIPIADIRSGVQKFDGVEHRMEKVPVDRPFQVFNDSKATNPESTVVAVRSMTRDHVLILGGSEKEVDYSILSDVLGQSCLKVILTGNTANEIHAALKDRFSRTEIVDDFDLAIRTAWKICSDHRADMLFSPACASFDRFRNFEHRGVYFKDLIKKIENEKS